MYSTFAHGWPAAGLLLMRLVAGIRITTNGIARLLSGPPIEAAIWEVVGIAAGLLLIPGLWTPIAGALVSIVGLWNATSRIDDPWAGILLATIGAGLAMLGPGALSVDARLFGWKRIDVRDPKS